MHKMRWRFVIAPALILADLFLLSLLPVVLGPDTSKNTAQPSKPYTTAAAYASPNVVTDSAAAFAESAERGMIKTGQASRNILRTMGTAAAWAGKTIIGAVQHTLLFVARTVGACLAFTADVITTAASFIVRIPGYLLGFVSSTATASPLTRPSHNAQLPVINPNAPITVAAHDPLPALQPVSQPVPSSNETAVWPIPGNITTEFGVPHWPYQPTHTGLDISSGKPSGVMPVTPFKPGRVAAVVRSGSGLGNNVTVDHGGGITSVYGHLASISVQVGQDVTKSSVLGYEGSTGASTGTHLHFEIRLNGQLVNPHQYVSGHP